MMSGASNVMIICVIPCLSRLQAKLKTRKHMNQKKKYPTLTSRRIAGCTKKICFHLKVQYIPNIDSCLHFVTRKHPYLNSRVCKLVNAFWYLNINAHVHKWARTI
jgi:hypothetical protein